MFIPFITNRRSGARSVNRRDSHVSEEGITYEMTETEKEEALLNSANPVFPDHHYGDPIKIYVYRDWFTAIASGEGIESTHLIGSGNEFEGRLVGGGNRAGVYGTSVYGSGYPILDADGKKTTSVNNNNSRGVNGANFPYYFWPVVWPTPSDRNVTTNSDDAYLYSAEYRAPTETTRPGGIQHISTFVSANETSTFHLITDRYTTLELMHDIELSCGHLLNTDASTGPNTTHMPVDISAPEAADVELSPESAIQYYRASTIALTLEGYNNTAALCADETFSATPLPPTHDATLLSCLNQTIGANALMMTSSNSAMAATMLPLWFVAALSFGGGVAVMAL